MSKQQIISSPLEDIMGERFGRYSKYIIQDRALPDARDGLKPVQRRILYAMYEDGNLADRGYRKSVKSVGLVIGNYHPHGESSVYDAMVRMSQYWKMREMLIDMHGNNGSMDDDPAAAMRYTEARLSKISETLLCDIDKDTVLFAPNFDDTCNEPTVLPAAYPNLLVNGITGIAAGYATNIPPHNLSEIIEGTIYRMQHPTCTLDKVMEFIKGPDFPTGGIIQGKEGIKDAFRTGKGRVVVRSKVEVQVQKTIQQIIITELPYEVIKSNLVKKMDDLRINKIIDGMMDVRDESDRNGLKIVIDLKKEVDAQVILQYLYKHTDLQVYYNYNMVAIVNKRPEQLGVLSLLDTYIEHRKEIIHRRSTYDYNKKAKRAHIVEGLIKALSVLDEIITIIRQSKDKNDAKTALVSRFNFSDEQAEAIVILRLYRLSNTDVIALTTEFDKLSKEMEELQGILQNPNTLNKVVIQELKLINKQFGNKRKSVLEDQIEELVINKQAMIQNEKVMITCSKDGYIKRVSMRSYNNNVQTKLKDEDQLVSVGEGNTIDKLLFFTSFGNYGYVDIHDIEESKWKDVGSHVNAYFKIENKENIIFACTFETLKSDLYVITVTRKGMIKKSSLQDYEVSRNNKLFSTMKVNKEDEVITVVIANEKDELLLLSEKGYITRYNLSVLPLTGVKGKGVKAMTLSEDCLVDAQLINAQSDVVFITETGMSKRIKISDIARTGRPARGEMVCKKNKSKPSICRYAIVGNIQDEFYLQGEDSKKIIIKDVTIMNKDSGFSQTLALDSYYRYVQLEKLEVISFEEKEKIENIIVEELNFDL